MKKIVILVMFLAILTSCGNNLDSIVLTQEPLKETWEPMITLEPELVISFDYIEYLSDNPYEPCFSFEHAISNDMIVYKYVIDSETTKYGFMDLKFQLVTEPISYVPGYFNNGFVRLTDENGSYILTDKFERLEYGPEELFYHEGKWVSQTVLREEYMINDQYYPYTIFNTHKYENIDLENYLVPISTSIDPATEEEMARPLWGYKTFSDAYISSNNNRYVIPPIYYEAMEFSDGLAAVRNDDGWGFIDSEGKTIISHNFDDVARGFINGLAVVGKRQATSSNSGIILYSLIDKNGNHLTEFRYTMIGDFYSGYAKTRNINGFQTYIDVSGEELSDIKAFKGFDFKNGFGRYYTGQTEVHFVNELGEIVNETPYWMAFDFNEDHCAVATDTGWTHIDINGNPIYDERYSDAGSFYNGIALVREMDNETSYLIDLEGNKYLEELNITRISSFNDCGYALAYSENDSDLFYYMIHVTVDTK